MKGKCFFRAAVTWCGGGLGAVLLLLLSAPAEGKVIGIVYPECCDAYDRALSVMKKELTGAGFGEGTVEIYEQKPSSDPMSWSNAFRKFIGVDADLIIIFSDEMLEIAGHVQREIATAVADTGHDSPEARLVGIGAHLLPKRLEIPQQHVADRRDAHFSPPWPGNAPRPRRSPSRGALR